ncbi:hypothetical protein J5I95_19465 [Candidatus Poribacteria bacterium]|nr:hypothetical protein [Candidatus Poribacteria bacterium]
MFFRKYWLPLTVFIVALVGVGLYYLQTRPPKDPILIVKPVEVEKQQPQPTAKAAVGDTSQGGHFHADGTWHGEPHEPPSRVDTSEPVQVSGISAPQREYNAGAGNPHPWEHVPVDLYDFEATKAAMIENINFFKANWDPKVYNRDVSIATAIIENIDNAARATQLGLFTPEQAAEIHALHARYYEFKGVIPGRVRQLEDEGYTLKKAIEIAAEERLQRWGVK